MDSVAQGVDLGLRRADLVPRDMIAVGLGLFDRHVAAPDWLARHPTPRSPPPSRLSASRIRGMLS